MVGNILYVLSPIQTTLTHIDTKKPNKRRLPNTFLSSLCISFVFLNYSTTAPLNSYDNIRIIKVTIPIDIKYVGNTKKNKRNEQQLFRS